MKVIACVHFLHVNLCDSNIFCEHLIVTYISVLIHEFRLLFMFESEIKLSLHIPYHKKFILNL